MHRNVWSCPLCIQETATLVSCGTVIITGKLHILNRPFKESLGKLPHIWIG